MCGDTVRVTHVLTGAHLHSHPFAYDHAGSSTQQQITGYAGSDNNDLWLLECSGSLQDKTGVQLRHVLTDRHLHSHPNHPAPVTPSQQEVTAWGGCGTTDLNDDWILEVEGGGVPGPSTRLRFIHKATGVALHSHKRSDPRETMGQQEVTGYAGRDDNDWWSMRVQSAIPRATCPVPAPSVPPAPAAAPAPQRPGGGGGSGAPRSPVYVGTYTIVNARAAQTTVTFGYLGGVVPINGVVRLDMIPGGRYLLTFNQGTGGTATPGQGHFAGLNAPLRMGGEQFAAAPGEYRIVD